MMNKVITPARWEMRKDNKRSPSEILGLSNSFRGSEISKPFLASNEKFNGMEQQANDFEIGFDELPDFDNLPSQNTSKMMS